MHPNTNVNEIDSEKDANEQVNEPRYQEFDTPLFLRDSSDGPKGDAQDEKDKTGE